MAEPISSPSVYKVGGTRFGNADENPALKDKIDKVTESVRLEE